MMRYFRLIGVVILAISAMFLPVQKVHAAGTTLVTNGSTSIGTLASVLTNTNFRITTSSLNSASITSISSNFVGPSSATLTDTAGWTQIQSVNADDASRQVSLGFNVSFNTTSYSSVYIGSNTYITFGSGSSNYSGLSASNPAIPGVHMCAADNSYQKVFYKLDNASTMRVRYEGNNSTSGTVGSPTIVYEAVFYSGQSYFDVFMGSNSRCGSDTTAPTISSVNSDKTNGSYKAGDVIDIDVTFSEAVTSTGNVTVTLETGATDRTCTFTVTNSSTGTCNYTVQAGDTSADLTVSSISGTIKDAANNSMSNFTPSTNLAANKALVIDTTASTVSNVTSSLSNGSYKSGQVVPIQVVFQENVTVVGTPQILLVTNSPTTTAVNYTSGSGSTTLVFNYTVGASNYSTDLDYASTGALSLNSGTIKDSAGNTATLTLAAPGASGSLGNNKALVIDNTAPTVAITSTTASQTGTNPIPVAVTFSETVTGFAAGDVTVTNGSAGNVAGSGANYTFDVTPTSSGTVTIAVSAAGVTDTAGNSNTVSNTLSRTFDGTPPTVSLSTAISSPTLTTPIPFTATFSEAVTGFVLADITASNAAVGNFVAVSSTIYTFDVSPIGHPVNNVDVTVSVSANKAQDAYGLGNTASDSSTPYAIRFDNHSPTTSLTTSATDPTNTSPFSVTATFSESVSGFAVGDISVSNGSASNFSGSGTTYTFDVTASGQSAVSVDVAAGVAQDGATNPNLVSNTLTRTYDTTAPTVALTTGSSSPTTTALISVTATFSEAVTGFATGDLSLTNGSASNFSGSGTTYTFDVTASSQGAVSITVPLSSAQDSASNGNSVSNTLSVTYDSAGPTLSEVTAVPSSDTDTTPNYTFSSSEAGTITYSGDCSSSTTSAASGNNTITFGTLSEGLHNNCAIRVTDSLGNVSSALIVSGFTITDPTAPTISSISANPSSTTATITWTTDESASSQVEYGLVSAYGSETTEADTLSRVTSHSVSLSSLKACARYFYRVKSTDSGSNIGTSSAQAFSTTGCAVSSIESGEESAITIGSGGSVVFTSGNNTATLTVPANFAAENATFQLNKLDDSSAPTSPSNTSLVQENFYDLIAIDANNNQVTSFDENITFTINYGSSVESSYVESSLDIYRYNAGTWEDQNCTLDASANTLTCTLTSFSVYAVFGQAQTSIGSIASAVISSLSNLVSCQETSPQGIPNLFQIDTTASTATVYFTPLSDTATYYVSYSTQSSAEEHGTQTVLGSQGVQKFTINSLSPNTTYYYKVRGQKGCAPGSWSNIKMTTTKSNNSNSTFTGSLIPDLQLDERFEKAAKEAAKIPVVEKAVDKKIKVTKIEINSKPSIISYVVKAGDSLWSIARSVLGAGSEYTKIAEQNIEEFPNLVRQKLAVGWELTVKKDDPPEEVQKEGKSQKLYDLDIKILASTGKPLEGVKVTLMSTPRNSMTNVKGVAHFKGVEEGKHRVFLAYEGYDSGGQAIQITGDNKNIELVMQVALNASFSSPIVMGTIVALTGVILFLLFIIWRKRYLYKTNLRTKHPL